jgi:hypothetical protein
METAGQVLDERIEFIVELRLGLLPARVGLIHPGNFKWRRWQ